MTGTNELQPYLIDTVCVTRKFAVYKYSIGEVCHLKQHLQM